MAQFEKGDYVIARESGSGRMVRGYGHVGYSAGDELKITSRAADRMMNVRGARGNVFTIDREKVRAVGRNIGEVPEGSVAADDPRIAWLFEDAARLANRLNLCRDFDRLCDALGAPGRVRTFTIKFQSSEQGIDITAKVQARSRKQAEEVLRGQIAQPLPPMRAIVGSA